jgi:hypothetical protein
MMHPSLYAELVADRICTLRREADAERLARLATRPSLARPSARLRRIASAESR